MHILCIVLELTIDLIQNKWEYKSDTPATEQLSNKNEEQVDKTLFICKFLLWMKIIAYFLSIVHLQNIAIVVLRPEKDENKMIVSTHIEVVVLYDLLIFYCTIFSLMFFLLFSRFFSFRTLRERMQLGGNMRYRRDFLEFVQEDVHYTLIALTEIGLFIYTLTHLQNAMTI